MHDGCQRATPARSSANRTPVSHDRTLGNLMKWGIVNVTFSGHVRQHEVPEVGIRAE